MQTSVKKYGVKKALALLMMLAMVLMLFPMSALAVDTISIATGEPVTINWSGTSGSVDRVDSSSSYYPSSFVLYIDGDFTYTATTGLTLTYSYSTDGGDAYVVALPSTTSTLAITLDSTTYTLSMLAPNAASSGTSPNTLNGYLPVGQYASGSGWGSIFSNGTNLTGTTSKITSGYGSTGVSLGACGGYTQFQFTSAVGNTSTNPYGVDFIVYGNAFSGNPEAGAVMVSSDGTNWYQLAGSLYYDTAKTLKNVDISYKKVTTTDSTFTSTGIWYKIVDSSNTTITDWTLFKANTAWWPEYTDEGYDDVYNISSKVNNVSWDTTNNIITYSDVNLTVDSDTTNDYQFGYADVHINGSSYGTAANPYAVTNTSTGGDGFDISWAVNSSGEPVSLSSISYVRVYTTAGLSSSNIEVLATPGIFGETSTEVCGIYTATGTGTGSTTTTPTVTVGGTAVTPGITSATTVNITADTATTVSAASSGNTVFVNTASGTGSASLSFTLGEGEEQIVRIIAKDSTTGLPYIGYLKLIGA